MRAMLDQPSEWVHQFQNFQVKKVLQEITGKSLSQMNPTLNFNFTQKKPFFTDLNKIQEHIHAQEVEVQPLLD